MELFLLGVLLGITSLKTSQIWLRSARRSPPPSPTGPELRIDTGRMENGPPFEVKVRMPFFSQSQGAFFRRLDQALPPGYRAFPHLYLSDFFLFSADTPKQPSITRLQAERVDFLIVDLDDHRPVAAITLDSRNPEHPQEQCRDSLRDLAFSGAGLLLLRLRTEDLHTQASLEALLWMHLKPAQRQKVN